MRRRLEAERGRAGRSWRRTAAPATSASRATTSPDCRRTPTSRSSSTTTSATGPSTTVTPRAASFSASSADSAGRPLRKSVTSSVHWPQSGAPCTANGVARDDADRPGRAPRSRGSRGSAARRGRTARPARAMSGSTSVRPVVTSSRRAATVVPSSSVSSNPASRPVGRGDAAAPHLHAVRRHLGAADLQQLGGRGALPAEVVVHVTGRGVAGVARVHHQDRAAGPAQGQRSAQAGGSAADDDHVVARLCSPCRRVCGVVRRIDKLRCRNGKLSA